MANEKQYKSKTLFIATRGVEEYRNSIQMYIKPEDCVLEIGCEWGTTSKLIFDKCKNLIATDISTKCIERAKEMYPEIKFDTLDAFDIQKAMRIARTENIDFNKIYIDMSGLSSYRALLDVISLMNLYASVFQPEVIVIKNGSLKEFARRCRGF